MLKLNDKIVLTIASISSEGAGVGRYNDMVVFVPHTAIGDTANVQITKVFKRYAVGILDKIITPSKDRISPICDLSGCGGCGGCQFQHMSYESELASKENTVKNTLSRLAGVNTDILPIITAYENAGYRNKAQFLLKMSDTGTLEYGFFKSGTNVVAPQTKCFLLPDTINEIAMFSVLTLNNNLSIDQKLNFRSIFIRESEKTKQIMLCFVTNSSFDSNLFSNILPEITAVFSSVVSIFHSKNDNTNPNIMEQKNSLIFGKPYIAEELSGVPVSLGVNSFFQVNFAAATKLLATVKLFLSPGKNDSILDLYCGVGVIGLSTAHNIKKLVGAEIVPDAIKSAKESARKMGLKNCDFYTSDVGNFVKKYASKYQFSAVIVDPPRKGCDTETISAISKISAAKIVMISCNPATLARDITVLIKNGYTLKNVQPVDMFPRTKHVECVVLLEK